MPTANKAKTESAPNLLVVVGLIVTALFLLYAGSRPKVSSIELAGERLTVEVADDTAEHKVGLGGRDSLDSDTAMLFIFNQPYKYGFWMADMNFDIDMIWLDAERTVVHVETEISPDTYPTVFYPNVNSIYVVETNSGWVKEHGLKLGDQVTFDL